MEILLDTKEADVLFVEDEQLFEEIEEAELSLVDRLFAGLNNFLSIKINPMLKALLWAAVAVVAVLLALLIAGLLFGAYALLSAIIPALPIAGWATFIGLFAIVAALALAWLSYNIYQWAKDLPKKKQKQIQKEALSASQMLMQEGRRLIEFD